ncbi:hypothetical protein BgAZ_101740 [Babesia gibsoni]|uniref:Uncharacterized protein n=1 Tax=Babesia gibsoni TaxID=33632 RepID=A0AAD8UUX1_BABGI|nr:hypothetical protein BgAZ_101740 [Babesia gibsoni]
MAHLESTFSPRLQRSKTGDLTHLNYPEGNFGRNQLLDGSISLSPLYPDYTNDLHRDEPKGRRPQERPCGSKADKQSLSLRARVCHPGTRTGDRLLGPCFKTGQLELVRRTAAAQSAGDCEQTHTRARPTGEEATAPGRYAANQTRQGRARGAGRAKVKRRRTRASTDAGVRSNCFPSSNFRPTDTWTKKSEHGAITLRGALFQET